MEDKEGPLTFGAVKSNEAILAVTLASITESIATAIVWAPLLTAVFTNEFLVTVTYTIDTDTISTAVLRTEKLAAVFTSVRCIADTMATNTAPVTVAIPWAGRTGTVLAFPAFITVAATNLLNESAMATTG